MKGKMGERKERATGGRDDAEADVKDKPEARTDAKKIDAEAEERKRGGKAEHAKDCRCKECRGGRAERKRGGHVHHENMEHMKHAKHLGPIHGEGAKHHAGRRPRAAGGKAGSDSHPFSSARKGENPPGRKEMDLD
jgi:hypothetical protein